MKALRYNNDFYILKGYFDKDTFKNLLNLGVKYENYKFYIPLNIVEEVQQTINVDFIDDNIEDYIYTGYKNPEIIKKSLISFEDINGSYIYVFNDDIQENSLKKIKNMPYFFMNMAKIKEFKEKIDRTLYLEDFLYNTELNIENDQLRKMLYSNNNTLYAHHIVNRICLNMLNTEQ